MKTKRTPACFKTVKATLTATLLIFTFYLSGCATYGEGIKNTLVHVSHKDYPKASESLKKSLKPEGEDRLLYHTELATIEHLDGQYERSNKNLDIAEKIADDLYTTRASDVLKSLMTNPRNGDYAGTDYEHIYINYFKFVNYMLMAGPNPNADTLEPARIEARRIDMKLDTLSAEKGTYKEVNDKDAKLFTKILKLFKKFQGDWLDQDWLQYREDAYVRYLSGVAFEMMGELDNARIDYQKAAELYEQGYTKQYKLGEDMGSQAWFDTIRIMKTAGGYESEWPALAKKKLSKQQRKKLREIKANQAQILVVQHMGLVPQKKEMNLLLETIPATQSLKLSPFLTGTEKDRIDQMSWFFLLYSDKGLMDLLGRFSEGGLAGVADSLTSKTVGLGPAWALAEELRLIQGIDSGLRVTVPYFSPPVTQLGRSDVFLNGKKASHMIKAESIAELAVQEQLLGAGTQINNTLARSSLKAITAAQANAAMGGGAVGALLGQIAVSGTDAPETRNWLLLPDNIRIARLYVEPGQYDLEVRSHLKSGAQFDKQTQQVNVKEGQIKMVVQRAIPKIAKGK